jgi:HEPN domain-containing protein
MSPKLSKQPIISLNDLAQVGDERLRESKVLLEAGCYAGAIYVGGYAVECYLKAAICHRLQWEKLLGTFKTHDLEALLLYTGLASELEGEILVDENFRQVVGMWNDKNGEVAIRYRDPKDMDMKTASTFLDCLLGVPGGLIPWLRKAIS